MSFVSSSILEAISLPYEIASYPLRFQKGCHCTTAEYTLSDRGYVVVENRCNRDSIDGPQSYIKGKAFDLSRLRVTPQVEGVGS